MTDRRLPQRFTIFDLIEVSGDRLSDRQIRHWLQKGWCIDVENVHIGGRVGQRWYFGSSGFVHATEMARLTLELGIEPAKASEIAAVLLMTGEYVTDHYSLYATRSVMV